MTTPLLGMIAIFGLALAMTNLSAKYEVYLHSLWRYRKRQKWGGL